MMVHVEQGTKEWFAARCGVATASRFADILAKTKTGESASRAKYRQQLVGERLTGRIEESYSSPAMMRGSELEPVARAMYEVRTQTEVQLAGFFKHNTLAAGASPDGLVGLLGGIEIKCPLRDTFVDYLGQPNEPSRYTAQIQGQMWICGFDWVDFVAFHPDFPPHLQLIVRRIYRNDEYIQKMETEIKRFLEEVDNQVMLFEKE